jgi:hypothetical protein
MLGVLDGRVDHLLQVHAGMDVVQEELGSPLLIAAGRASGDIRLAVAQCQGFNPTYSGSVSHKTRQLVGMAVVNFIFFHGNREIDIRKLKASDHALVHRVVGVNVRDNNAKQIIGIAGQAPCLDDLRNTRDELAKCIEPFRGVARRPHRNENGHRHVRLAPID